MKTSTLFAMAAMALTQIADVSAADDPTRVIRSPANKVRAAQGQQSPSTLPRLEVKASQGCFSSSGNMTNTKVDLVYLSSGACEDACKANNMPVMAVSPGACLCGEAYPPKDTLSKDSNCNYPCPGWPAEACGSLGEPGFFSVFNVGLQLNVPFLPSEEDKTSSTSTTSATSTSTSTSGPTAPAATQTDANDGDNNNNNNNSDDEKKSGPNTAGIAAGVVVGVAVVAGGIGGFFFWMRRRRNAEIEEDHRRNAAVNAFISGSKPPSSHGSISMTDSRLDPVLAHRRMSDGSIADNEDYSRRILRVTNA